MHGILTTILELFTRPCTTHIQGSTHLIPPFFFFNDERGLESPSGEMDEWFMRGCLASAALWVGLDWFTFYDETMRGVFNFGYLPTYFTIPMVGSLGTKWDGCKGWSFRSAHSLFCAFWGQWQATQQRATLLALTSQQSVPCVCTERMYALVIFPASI